MSYFKYTGEDNLESMEFAANYNGMLIDLLRKNLHPKATTLDFGCGTGFYAELLAKHDFEVIGLEPDEQLAKRVGERGIDCYNNLESIHVPVHQIYSLNVLENIEDDAEVLKALYDGLENEGIAVFLCACSPVLVFSNGYTCRTLPKVFMEGTSKLCRGGWF